MELVEGGAAMADRLSHQDARADQLQYKYYPMLMPFVMTDEEIEAQAVVLIGG